MTLSTYLFTLFPSLLGNLFVVQCEKKFLIYSAEEGKRISLISLSENLICRWLKLSENETLILAFIDIKSFSIKFSINCEFDLKGGEMILESNDPIFDVQVDPKSNDLLILQNSTLTRLKFPFNSNEEQEQENSIHLISKLAKNLKTVLSVVDDVKGQLLKLLKLDDSVFMRLSESDCSLIRKFLLFGDIALPAPAHAQAQVLPLNLSETEVLEWKSKLKKQHAELLVSVQEFSSVIRSFSNNYPKFCPVEIDRFLEIDLIQLEDKSRLLQHDLAEFLVWLENLIIPDIQINTLNSGIKPFKPEIRALELVKSIKRSNDSIMERHELWLNSLNNFILILDLEFKDLVNKINSVNLQPIERIENVQNGFNRILSTNPLIILNEKGTEIIKYNKEYKEDKDENIIILPDEYIAHYFKNNQLQLICKGMIQVSITDSVDITSYDSNNTTDPEFVKYKVHVNPLSNQLYLVPSINPTKLLIQ